MLSEEVTVPAEDENPVKAFPVTVDAEMVAEADPGPLAVTSPVKAVM
jgi:hypothetical protein